MSIKKSSLERKWYYRVAKVFFLLLPLLAALALFLSEKINVPEITQKNIPDILQKNAVYIVYVVIGVILYFVILNGIWRLLLYVLFGGLEDDTKSSDAAAPPVPVNKTALIPILIIIGVVAVFVLFEKGYLPFVKPNVIKNNTYGASCTNSDGKKGLFGTNGNCYTCSTGTAVTNPQGNCSGGKSGVYCCGTNDNNRSDGCIPTGCGSGWWCSGSYYIDGQEINVPGLCYPTHPENVYPSWSGTCRQCP